MSPPLQQTWSFYYGASSQTSLLIYQDISGMLWNMCRSRATYLFPHWSLILSQQPEYPTELETPKPFFHRMISMSLTGDISGQNLPLPASPQRMLQLLPHLLVSCCIKYWSGWTNKKRKQSSESAATTAISNTSRSYLQAITDPMMIQALRTSLPSQAQGAMTAPTVETLPPAHHCSWQMAPRTVQSLKCGEVGQYLTSGGNFSSLAPIN